MQFQSLHKHFFYIKLLFRLGNVEQQTECLKNRHVHGAHDIPRQQHLKQMNQKFSL